jgi:acetyl-CoA C-acetyltransferase
MGVDLTRVPVIAGAGQCTSREEDPAAAPDPFTMMEAVARAAAESAHWRGGPAGLTHCWMVHSLSLRHGAPAAALAHRLGADGAEARCSGMGGSIPQWLVDRAADLVSSGARPRVLIAGAEALATRRRAKKAGVRLEWPSSEGFPETWPPISMDLGVHPVERAHGLEQATTMYALIESALAHAAGDDPEAHRRAMGELMDRCNAVAAANPHSWFPARRDAAELTTVSAENRMICWPYPKYLNAVMDVDMAAAVIVTDAATAREWGLGADDVAYVAGWADAKEVWYLSQRPEVHRSPALAACTASALASAGLDAGEVDGFDLYGCFPSSIEVARDTLGVDPADPRPLTLTGALPYHGGPGSNYVTHALANTLDWLRAGRGESVLVHGNGFYLTTHSVGVYRSRPPPGGPPVPDDRLQARLDAAAVVNAVDDSLEGPAEVVGATVPHDRDGSPGTGIVVVEAGGRRTAARASAELTATLIATDPVGTTVQVAPAPGGTGNIATPG